MYISADVQQKQQLQKVAAWKVPHELQKAAQSSPVLVQKNIAKLPSLSGFHLPVHC